MKASYKITVFHSLTGAFLFNVYCHDASEDQAEAKAAFWWNDDANTRSTYAVMV